MGERAEAKGAEERESEDRSQKAALLQRGFFQFRHFEKMFQEAELEGLIAVNQNRKPDDAPGFSIDMVAAVDHEQART